MCLLEFSFNGSIITPVDMSPPFAGTLMGLSNTIASVAAFIFPVIQTFEQWNKIFATVHRNCYEFWNPFLYFWFSECSTLELFQ
ncbi:hypothetical protein TNCT_345421 [Trichonephila clavata]|uniref:Uncharacterized protein n=1 Tax=Trichonephila clavata TaxID=2740835 RepID=A0A8X6H238_TRICU|nr:hypothetical protein TNCT_345421 [Trichonephila clavata]